MTCPLCQSNEVMDGERLCQYCHDLPSLAGKKEKVPLPPSFLAGGFRSVSRKLRSVMERDGIRCWLCGGSLDLRAKASAPFEYDPLRQIRASKERLDLTPTIDHVVPRSQGGSSELSNLRLAHHRCNTNRKSWWPHTIPTPALEEQAC